MSESGSPGPRHERIAIVLETGDGRFGNAIAIGPHRLVADEPASVGGLGKGPDPYEYLLAGLGACTAMTVRLYADRTGWPLPKVEVTVRHVARLADGAERDIFEREINLSGELSDEERARLLDIADRCPVSRTLAAGSVIRSRLIDDNAVGAASS